MAQKWSKGEVALKARDGDWHLTHGLSCGDWSIHKDDHGYWNLSYKGMLFGRADKQATLKGLHGLVKGYDFDYLHPSVRSDALKAVAVLVRIYIANTEIADNYDLESQVALVGELFKKSDRVNNANKQ